MLNQLLKLGLFVTAGMWLKHRIRGLAMLIFVLIITRVLHSEYLAYVEHSGYAPYLEISYIIKWLVFFISCGLYYFLVERSVRKNPVINRNTIERPTAMETKEDGFDYLRQKKTLESDLDKALKKTKAGS